jgi:hypothetical protein
VFLFHPVNPRWSLSLIVLVALAWLGVVGMGCVASRTGSAATEPFPSGKSKKGLQVQMVEDALALGVAHAALNINLAQVIHPAGDSNSPSWTFHGRTLRFHRDYLDSMDAQIRPLSEQGVVVSLILLNYVSGDPGVRRILQHPDYDPACPNHLSAFHLDTDEGRVWLQGTLEFLADRWSRRDGPHGRVWNWIVGNEVNSHWFWSNQGRVTMDTFVDGYLPVVRMVHDAVRRSSPRGRVYVSLDHHWNIRYAGGTEGQTFAGRPFLDRFSARAKETGDFDWHVAYHPYPENLFEPRSWLDTTATDDWRTTPRITFKNLEQLLAYLDQPSLRFEGRRRRVILSEQGFHTPEGPDGERIQAEAYAYAWKRVDRMEGIDAFILHRHVDHRDEGGLRLGLWTRRADSVSTPDRPKLIHEVFRKAGSDTGLEVGGPVGSR